MDIQCFYSIKSCSKREKINLIFMKTSKFKAKNNLFPLWLRNRFISAGYELVLSHTKKSCIALYYRQLSQY